MKSLLVASPDKRACEITQETLGEEYTIQITDNLDECLELFREKRQEFTSLKSICIAYQSFHFHLFINFKNRLVMSDLFFFQT